MKKRILSLVLAALLCMGLAASAMAAEEETTGLSIQWISLSEGQKPLRYNRKLHWLVVEGSSAFYYHIPIIMNVETGEHIEDFNDVSAFSEGLARVGDIQSVGAGGTNFRYGFVDQNGKVIVGLKYTEAGNFSDGLARVGTGEWREQLNGIMYHEPIKYGFIDKKGKVVIPLKYDSAGDFSEGLAKVGKDGKYGFIDKDGREVIPLKYDWAWDFSNGLAHVGEGDRAWYIDKTGREATPPEAEEEDPLYADFVDGLALRDTGTKVHGWYRNDEGDVNEVHIDNQKWGFINENWTEVVPIKYEDGGICQGEDSDTLFWVKDGDQFGIFESPYCQPDAENAAEAEGVPSVSLAPAIIAGVLVAAAATAGIILLVKKKKIRVPLVILMGLAAVLITVLVVFWLCPVHYKWKLQRQLADMVSIGKSSVGGTSGITGGGQMNIGSMLVTGVVMLLVIFVLLVLPKWRQKNKRTATGNGDGQAPTHTPPSAPLKQEKPTQSDQTPAPVPAAVAPTQPSSAAPSPAPAPAPAAEPPRFCSNCGKPLAPGVNFCPGCGHNLKGGDGNHEG